LGLQILPRAVGPRFEPADVDDAKIERDKIYAELRIVADLAQKLSDSTNRAAVRLATLPVVGDQQIDDTEQIE
jgi:hypothetical protein